MSFASSRTGTKTSDLLHNPNEPSHDLQKDYKTRSELRSKFSKDKDKDETSRERSMMMNGRRKENHSDKWANARARKVGQPENLKFQREDERDTGVHDGRQDLDYRDNPSRRNGLNRGKLDQRWHREQGPPSSRENDRVGSRGHGWRDRDRQEDKEWTRASRTEQEPEWLEEADEDDKKQVHTQEEFQLWKERMRAGTVGESQGKTHSSLLQSNEDNVAHEVTMQTSMGGGFDKLLGKWNDVKKPETGGENGQAWKTQGSKSKSSRFAGFFAPQDDSLRIVPEPTGVRKPVEQNDSSDDKEGFQRILQMLGSMNTASNSHNQSAATLDSETVAGGLNGWETSNYHEDIPSSMYEGGAKRNAMLEEQKTGLLNNQSNLNSTLSSRSQTTDPIALRNLLALSSGPPHVNADIQTHRSQHLHNDRALGDANMTTGRTFHASHMQPLNPNMNQLNPNLSKDSEFLLNLMHQPNIRSPNHAKIGRAMTFDSQNHPYFDPKLGINPEAASQNCPQLLYDDRIPFDSTSVRQEINAGMGIANKEPQKAVPNYHDGPVVGPPRRNTSNQFQRNSIGNTQQLNTEFLPQKHNMMPMQQERALPPPGFGAGSHVLRQHPGFGLPHQPLWNTPNIRNNNSTASFNQGQGAPPIGSPAFLSYGGVPPGFPPGRS